MARKQNSSHKDIDEDKQVTPGRDPSPPQKIGEDTPLVPGVGVAGRVICPVLSLAGRDADCRKGACEWWVALKTEKDGYVGRCAMSWGCMISTEIRAAVDRLTAAIKE